MVEQLTSVPAPPVPRLPDPWSLHPLGAADGARVAEWMSRPHLRSTWDQDWGSARWSEELAGQAVGVHSRPCLARREGRVLAYLELYRVEHDKLAGRYPHHAHDLGVHIALVEAEDRGHGLGSELLAVVATGLLAADPGCQRVVAEPATANRASVRAFGKAGFQPRGEIVFAHKTSTLVVRDRRRPQVFS